VDKVALNLTLEVLQVPEWEVGDAWRKVFDTAGGRIGRSFDCDWVLSNQYISRHHATVSCVDGIFYVEAVGENGVAVNDSNARLPKRERRALKDGDHLFLDEYEITVAIADIADEAGASSAAALDTLDLTLPVEIPDSGSPAPSSSSDPPWSSEPQLSLEPPVLQPPVPQSKSTPVPPPAPIPPPASTPTQLKVAPPKPAPKPSPPPSLALAPPPAISPPPATSPPPAVTSPQLPAKRTLPASATSPVTGFDGAIFLKGAGLDPRAVPPEMAETLGQIVRAVVQGLIDVLRARAEFRDQFRMSLTRVQTSQNNPLKFAVNAEGALAAMLRTSSPGYLSPLEAFEDAFDDIRFHQLAMLAGMRAGFESMTRRFEPKKLMEQTDRHRQGSLSKLGAKGRYWDRYVDLFEEVATNPDTSFRRLYGEEFSDAYERQLEDLKRNRAKESL